MLTLALKNLLAHKMRLFSTASAVFIGVAFMAGTLIFTDTLSATFDNVLADANREVDAMVRSPEAVATDFGAAGSHVKASTLGTVRQVEGVDEAAVRVSGYAQLIGPDGKPVGDQAQAPAFGLNWTDVQTLNPYRLASGTAPARDDEIVIDQESADAAGYETGDIATVLTKGRPREFTIAGIATYGSAASAAGASAVLFTDRTAEELLSSPGQIDGVVVTAVDGTSQEDLVDALSTQVPDLEVVTGQKLIEEDQASLDEAFGPFRVFMLIFAGIAVFVGAFIINNTFSITVAQRTKEMASLRTLGASRRQVLCAVLAEATLTGVLASGVGIVAGLGAARGLRALMTASGIELPDGPAVINPTSMLIAFGIGVVVTVISAFLPARRASKILPIAALRDVAVDRSSSSGRRAILGTLITVGGGGLLLLGLGGAGIAAVGLGAIVMFVGVAVLGPVLARPVSRLIGLPLEWAGITGEMATRNAMRSPKRTARTASALMIGVGLVAFITVFGASVKTSFGGSLEESFQGTHVVDSGVFDSRGGISPKLADDLNDSDGVSRVSEARMSPAVVDGVETDIFEAFTADTIGETFDLGSVEGDLGNLGSRGIAVDEAYAAEQDWDIGSKVPVTLASGDFEFTVRAVYQGSDWVGDQFVDVAAFDAYVPDALDFRIYVAGDDATVKEVAAPYPTASVLDKDEFFDSASAEIDQVLGVVYAMLVMAIGIAVLGISNTLALSIFERTRELGLLRAVGMTRSQIRATVRGESVIIALFGTSLGIAVGTFFGWATVRALADEGIDTLTLPGGRMLVIAVLAVLAGVIAAVLPARRAARLKVLDAIATA